MTVRAKFKCSSVTRFEHRKRIHLDVVQNGSEENKQFTKFTPSGNMEITIENDAPAATFFKVGKEYYLDFSAASEEG